MTRNMSERHRHIIAEYQSDMEMMEIYSRQLMLGLRQFEDSQVQIDKLLGDLGQPSKRHKRFTPYSMLKPLAREVGSVFADAFGIATSAQLENLKDIEKDLYNNQVKLHTNNFGKSMQPI